MHTNITLGSVPNAIEILANNALRHGERVAWIHRDGTRSATWTWRDIYFLAAETKRFLQTCGIKLGDRVAWQAPNSLDWILLELSCNWIGAISCPIDIRIQAQTRTHLLNLVDPKLFFADSPVSGASNGAIPLKTQLEPIYSAFQALEANRLSEEGLLVSESLELWHSPSLRPEPDSAATILFTSGTTGAAPKGVMLSHANLVLNGMAKLQAMPQRTSDHRINVLPFAHAYARTCELTAWLLSASSMETCSGGEQLFLRLPTSGATLLNAVPLVYERIWDRWNSQGATSCSLKAVLGASMRQLASGGAPISIPLREAFARAGYPIYQGYGLTETSPVVCSNTNSIPPTQSNLSGVGTPVDGMKIQIDEAGNLYVKGTGVMLGYWNDPVATAARFRDLDGSGMRDWLATGDLATQTSDGTVYILGRSDEAIVLANGYKLHPLQIESSLKLIDGIVDCIALPYRNGEWQLLLQTDYDATETSHEQWFQRIHAFCPSEVRHRLGRIEIHKSPWTAEQGLLNFKGGKRRAEFMKRFGSH